MKQLIIGGGMSGLVSAVISAKIGNDVTLVEQNSRVGKKLAVSGNGRCNYGNANVCAQNYNDSKIVERVLKRIPFDRYVKYMEKLGIYGYTDESGRLYPLSDHSASVIDALRFEAEKSGVTTICDSTVNQVKQVGNSFTATINGVEHKFDDVVLCCGSFSQANRPSLDQIVPKSFFTALSPALVPVKVANADKTLAGVRAKCNVSLYCDDALVKTESGEVQFKENALSGICIFNLSSVIARSVVRGEKHDYVISLDLFPSFSVQKLTQIVAERLATHDEKNLLYGIAHNKLAESVLKRSKSCGNDKARVIAETAKNFSFDVERLFDFAQGQVTAGGIDEQFVDDNFTLPNGLRAVGEVLNVDGECGGYNLYFAGASAMCLFTEGELQRVFCECDK